LPPIEPNNPVLEEEANRGEVLFCYEIKGALFNPKDGRIFLFSSFTAIFVIFYSAFGLF
jgi:hypothetical protein